jgi:hypothetical protein
MAGAAHAKWREGIIDRARGILELDLPAELARLTALVQQSGERDLATLWRDNATAAGNYVEIRNGLYRLTDVLKHSVADSDGQQEQLLNECQTQLCSWALANSRADELALLKFSPSVLDSPLGQGALALLRGNSVNALNNTIVALGGIYHVFSVNSAALFKKNNGQRVGMHG